MLGRANGAVLHGASSVDTSLGVVSHMFAFLNRFVCFMDNKFSFYCLWILRFKCSWLVNSGLHGVADNVELIHLPVHIHVLAARFSVQVVEKPDPGAHLLDFARSHFDIRAGHLL